MDRHRVVQAGLDTVLAQKGAQLITLFAKDHIKVINMLGIYRFRNCQWQPGETRVIAASDGSALFGPRVQPSQFVAENDPLNSVHAVVETQLGVGVPFALSMIAQ